MRLFGPPGFKGGFPQTPSEENLFGKIIKKIYFVGSRCYDQERKLACIRYASGPAAESRQPGCKASGERTGIIRGESSLSTRFFPGFRGPEAL